MKVKRIFLEECTAVKILKDLLDTQIDNIIKIHLNDQNNNSSNLPEGYKKSEIRNGSGCI